MNRRQGRLYRFKYFLVKLHFRGTHLLPLQKLSKAEIAKVWKYTVELGGPIKSSNNISSRLYYSFLKYFPSSRRRFIVKYLENWFCRYIHVKYVKQKLLFSFAYVHLFCIIHTQFTFNYNTIINRLKSFQSYLISLQLIRNNLPPGFYVVNLLFLSSFIM